MRRFTRISIVTALLALPLLPACEETGLAGTDSGVPDTGSDPIDAGNSVREISYTPEGCGYQVATPVVEEAGMHAETFGATPSTDHVHVSWAGPPESTFAVNWRSDLDTRASAVLYGTDRAAVEAADEPGTGVSQQLGHFMRYPGLTARMATTVHEAHVCGLTANTTYYYKVGGAGHWSEVLETSTAPMPGSTGAITFAVTGDSRGYVDPTSSLNIWAISQRRIADRAVDFQLFSGDAVILGPAQDQWDDFFASADGDFVVEDFLASVPLMMANGNHDQLAVPYLAQFALPQEVTPGEVAQGEEWYSFDYGNAHFVFLNDTVEDSSVLGGAEATWLEADLDAVDRTATPWIFVVHHRPFYTCQSTHSPDTSLRAAWQPIFDSHGVDIVFTGHNHVYERSAPIRGLEGGQGVVAAAGANGVPTIDTAGIPSGTVYLVAAGVGAPLYPVNTDCPTSLEGQSVRNYVIVQLVDRAITVTAYNAETDAVIDSFTYTK